MWSFEIHLLFVSNYSFFRNADIWGTSDSFHYLYGSTSGDASIEMFVESFTGSSLYKFWAKGGLMLRDSLDANSKHFSLYVTISAGLSNQWRSSTGGATSHEPLPGSSNSNMWLKITKTGNVFQAYYKTSASNSIWSTLGSYQTIDFGSDIFYYGVAVTSHETTRVATLSFSSLQKKRTGPNPMHWGPDLTDIDIGDVGTTGSSTVSNDNMIQVSGAGSGELYHQI